MRWAVIGDVGGHLDGLVGELRRLGADPESGILPEDLTVVQLGDLVHRGPASEQVLALVDRFLRHSPGRWVQLVGNHEAQYLRHPAFQWRDWIDVESADLLRGWWADGLLRAAMAVPTSDGEVLVTHAGLTQGFWRRDLGAPDSASQAADLLNQLSTSDSKELFRGGTLLTGSKPDHRAGPLWAQTNRELLPSWLGLRLPFSQVHGHSSLYDWKRREWRADGPIAHHTTLDPVRAHETTWLPGGYIVGIDPCHDVEAQPDWQAWQPSERPRHEADNYFMPEVSTPSTR